VKKKPELLSDNPKGHDEFQSMVLEGLSARPKSLQCRFLYDASGSKLFEEITELPEYYVTRAELAILGENSREIAEQVATDCVVVEFGSGSSRKTEILLNALSRPHAYLPIDISETALVPASERIQSRFPEICVRPILGGFHDLDVIRLPFAYHFRLGFFPGSTIGNMTPDEAMVFLRAARRTLGAYSAFLVGVDLKKNVNILLPAYDDSRGVTAKFNLNILRRINRELDGEFDLQKFAHEAIYNEHEGRIEMHLRSLENQYIRIAEHIYFFEKDETIHTENSYKYSVVDFISLASNSDWTVAKTWIDKNKTFSVHLLM
jgi:dimethylhistidine N-methyltransferase